MPTAPATWGYSLIPPTPTSRGHLSSKDSLRGLAQGSSADAALTPESLPQGDSGAASREVSPQLAARTGTASSQVTHGTASAILSVTGSPASRFGDLVILEVSKSAAGGSLAPASAADRLAVLLRTSLDQFTVPLARAAVEFTGQEDWARFGYARLEDHARERFKRSGRWVRDLAALGRGFDTLPGLEAAVTGSDGDAPIGQVAALLVTKTASPESVGSWLRLARIVTIRELKEDIRRT